MSARDAILAAIRRAAVPAAELPDLLQVSKVAAEPPPDLVRHFIAVLKAVGGRAVELAGPEALASAVSELAAVLAVRGAGTAGAELTGSSADGGVRGLVSCVPGLAISTLTIGPDASRQQLDAIELAVIPDRRLLLP
ncbi:MAG: hypothetical protein AAB409_06025 [Gemmatimonadota bacterium]